MSVTVTLIKIGMNEVIRVSLAAQASEPFTSYGFDPFYDDFTLIRIAGSIYVEKGE